MRIRSIHPFHVITIAIAISFASSVFFPFICMASSFFSGTRLSLVGLLLATNSLLSVPRLTANVFTLPVFVRLPQSTPNTDCRSNTANDLY
ncbi:hypothetical protein BC939DRAFT_435695 [Gamsiella multidivaricata]|uniref:uncharacterized protein n=1 Tax=Gamsiella multidivaricata TaxID=101098 RepID=UPI00221F9193|nr:uncharacterized protein BC939DRAFT_435695 [Gamsiella multidivaricata]KAI7832512.1 hypothetical protein BC939DRAFT_435695 [Gamsiella multidivaricata]